MLRYMKLICGTFEKRMPGGCGGTLVPLLEIHKGEINISN